MTRHLPHLGMLALLLACTSACCKGEQLRELLAAVPASEAAVPAAELAGSSACCESLAKLGFSSNLPLVVIDTAGEGLRYHVDTPIQLCTCSPPGLGLRDYGGQATAAVRGSSSANFTKKSYALQLHTGAGNSSASFPLLGMLTESDWVLYGGDEVDLTQGMRNYLAYSLARGSGRYATRTVFCEVFLVNDSRPLSLDHYSGIYIMEEKVKRGRDRVDIKPLQPPNLSGGFIFLFDNDNVQEGDTTFGPTKHIDLPFLLKYPKGSDNGTPAALDWLLSYLNAFEDALFDPAWLTGRSPAYTSYIDGPSFVDYLLLVELTKNPDGYRGSTFMHKDRDGPLAMGPAWDYNEAFGECCGYPIDGWQRQGESGPGVAGGSAISPEGWRFRICEDQGRCKVEPGDGTSAWYRRMWQDQRFRQAAAVRWQQLRAGNWSDGAIESLITSTAAMIKPAVLRNYQRYEWVLAKPWYASGEVQWTSEVSQLHDWLLKRVAWMDQATAQAAASASVINGSAATPGDRR